MPSKLWSIRSADQWAAILDRYPDVIALQGVEKLPELDHWYRTSFADEVEGRKDRHVTLDELSRVTEWKMARGVWRHRNLVLVRSNDAREVQRASRIAFKSIEDPTAPIRELARLSGVGPATASAVVAAIAPETHPFLDDIVAAQVPGLGKVKYTMSYYVEYADALRKKAEELGHSWTPVMVERALWTIVGGKAGVNAT